MNNKLEAFKESCDNLLGARDYVLSKEAEGDHLSVHASCYNRSAVINFLRPLGPPGTGKRSGAYIKWKDGLLSCLTIGGDICPKALIGNSSLMLVYYDRNDKSEVLSRLAILGLINHEH